MDEIQLHFEVARTSSLLPLREFDLVREVGVPDFMTGAVVPRMITYDRICPIGSHPVQATLAIALTAATSADHNSL